MLPDGHIVHKEMGYTHKEFMRLLPKAVGSTDFQVLENEIQMREGGRLLSVLLGEETERRLGNFRLPLLPVDLVFTGYDEAGIKEVLERFWRAYQKGGG